ncbi:MAG: nucleotidyltransferase family protein [Dehalococcoidales bacterium]|nr:nucleotidyltransferase family protein [Dehalococcoidales bacterium]
MSYKRDSSKASVILLAAGMARRMGKPKQLLPLGSSTIMGITLDNITASSVNQIIVVTGASAEATGAIASRANTTVAHNPDYRHGMSTSLHKGLERLDPGSGLIMVALADQPLTRTETYNLIIEHAKRSQKGIVIPVHHGKQGNPIVIRRSYLPELLAFEGDVGGRELLVRHPDDILRLEVDDPGVITNINTPHDYEKIKSEFARGGYNSA